MYRKAVVTKSFYKKFDGSLEFKLMTPNNLNHFMLQSHCIKGINAKNLRQ